MVRSRLAAAAAASPLAFALVLATTDARADEHSIIRSPGDHPPYIFEAEPHLVLGYDGPFRDRDDGFAVGFRGSVHIADGFVKSINDSVGIGFGFDIGTNGNVFVPVVMQWNFWLSTHFSVMGEPGIGFGSGRNNVLPVLYAGGRYHFTDRIALTLRVGYPDISLGVSFFL